MKKHFIFLLAVIMSAVLGFGSFVKADDFTDAMTEAKANLTAAMNKNELSELTKVRGQFERILQLKKDEWLVNYYIALTDYNLGIAASTSGDIENTKKYTESGLKMLEKSIEGNADFAESYILEMYLNFNRWSYEQEKMNDIIAASKQADAMAKSLGGTNPRYYLAKGINSYWTPEQFGGGVDGALEYLEKSIKAFDSFKPVSERYPTWGHDWALGYTALALIKRDDDGDMKKAKEVIDEGMKLYPDSGFISGFVLGEYNKESGQ